MSKQPTELKAMYGTDVFFNDLDPDIIRFIEESGSGSQGRTLLRELSFARFDLHETLDKVKRLHEEIQEWLSVMDYRKSTDVEQKSSTPGAHTAYNGR